jgi:YYY domain-containing protein
VTARFVLDCYANCMRAFAHWYVVVEILGALVLPLAWRLFRHLPDRGYCFGKILAILLVGYAFWTGTAYGLLRNELGGAVLAVLIVTVASGVAGWRMLRGTQAGRRPLVEGMRRLTPVILTTEALFLLAFGGWAVMRSWGPEANHTEQPMDLLLLSAIWTSSSFPPQDPWLAGYAISYYYFGYWLLATIARLAGQPPEIAYNLGQACWFGLLLTACFGVGFNLAALARRTSAEAGRRGAPMLGGLLAAVSVALIGNLQGLLDAVRVGWDWLRNPNRAVPLAGETTTWWWWRSSRVISDRDPLGRPVEIIDEFPFFSYLVGDNHPHLLAMPFVLLVVAVSLSMYLVGPLRPATAARERAAFWIDPSRWFHGGLLELAIIVITAGGLAFLNPWDLTCAWIFVVLSAALVAPRRAFVLTLILPVGTVVAYWPYLLGAQTQISGFRPNLFNPTSLGQLTRVFGVLVPGLAALLWLAWSRRPPGTRLLGWSAAGALGASTLWLMASVCWAVGSVAGQAWLDQLGAPADREARLSLVFERWSQGWPTLAVLVPLLAVTMALIWARRRPTDATWPRWVERGRRKGRCLSFVLLLAAVGLGLVLVPELGYLLDAFGTRMNTVFKFYYQAWLLLALAASHGTFLAISEVASIQILGRSSLGLLVAALVFPIVSLSTRLSAPVSPTTPTLDALAYMEVVAPDEAAAIRWLRTNTRPDARVLQAVGASYDAADCRVSVATGRATLLGWEGHEVQWRGAAFAAQAAGRASAVRSIYRDAPLDRLAHLLEAWQIDYVYVGPRERAKYEITAAAQARFDRVMELAFEQDRVRIYRRRG